MIAIRQNWPSGNINVEGAQFDELQDHVPPIDVYINAIHRIAQLQIVPDTEFLIQTTLTTIHSQPTMSLDGAQSVVAMVKDLEASGLLHHFLPRGIDITFFYYNENSTLLETIFQSDFYKGWLFKAAQVGQINSIPDTLGTAITAGEFDLITILELRVA